LLNANVHCGIKILLKLHQVTKYMIFSHKGTKGTKYHKVNVLCLTLL
jgi:hypothetical protein